MRELVYYIAISLDGFIAREDGSFEDFPWDDDFVQDLLERYPETFPAPFHQAERSRADNRRFGAVLMGRHTYEVGVRQGLTSPYPTLDQYVFSRSWTESPDPAVTLVSTGAVAFVSDLKEQDGGAIWICGGGALAADLFAAGLVDEVVVKLNPLVLGAGIPLFGHVLEPTRLELRAHHVYGGGQVLLHYDVSG